MGHYARILGENIFKYLASKCRTCYAMVQGYIFDNAHITNNKIIFPNFLVSSCDSAERESKHTHQQQQKEMTGFWLINHNEFFFWLGWWHLHTLSPPLCMVLAPEQFQHKLNYILILSNFWNFIYYLCQKFYKTKKVQPPSFGFK